MSDASPAQLESGTPQASADDVSASGPDSWPISPCEGSRRVVGWLEALRAGAPPFRRPWRPSEGTAGSAPGLHDLWRWRRRCFGKPIVCSSFSALTELVNLRHEEDGALVGTYNRRPSRPPAITLGRSSSSSLALQRGRGGALLHPAALRRRGRSGGACL